MRSKRQLIGHFSTILCGSAFNMIIGFISVPIITRLVNTEDYGMHGLFTLYADIAVMILCLGLDQAFVRFYYNRDGYAYKSVLLKFCCKTTLMVCFWCFLGFYLIFYVKEMDGVFSNDIMLLLCTYIIIELISRFSFLLLRLEYNTKAYTIMNVMHKTIFAVLAIVLLNKGLESNFMILVICSIIALLIPTLISIVLKYRIWFYSSEGERINKEEVFKYGLPMIISLGVFTVFNGIDRMSLNYYCGADEVGVYTAAQNILKVFTIVQTAFNTVWKPFAFENHENNSTNNEFYAKAFDWITVVMFMFGLTLVFSKDLLVLILGDAYKSGAYIIPCLCFYPIMYTVSEVTSVGIDFSMRSNRHVLVAVTACITNFIGNVVLIPYLGGKGAAISTGISYIVFFVVRTYYSEKLSYLNFNTKRFWIVTFVTFLFFLINMFIPFGLFICVMYFFVMILLVILYKNTVAEIYVYIRRRV